MQLTEKAVDRILDQVQEYIGGKVDHDYTETKVNKNGVQYVCFTTFINLGLTKKQAKMLQADPRGVEITVRINPVLQEGKLLLGNRYSEQVVSDLAFDEAEDPDYIYTKFLTNYDESKKRRGKGVYLNQIKEASDSDSEDSFTLKHISKLIRLAGNKYRDPKIAAVANTGWAGYTDRGKEVAYFDISGLTEKQVWQIEDTIGFNDYGDWGDFVVGVRPEENVMYVIFR